MEFFIGQIVTIGSFIFIASIIVLFLIKSIKNDYNDKHNKKLTISEVFQEYKKDFFQNIYDEYSIKHKEIFKQSLITAKLTILSLLGFITFVYQIKYDKELYFRTYLGIDSHRWKVFIEIAIGVFFGMLTTIIILISRRKNIFCPKNIQNIIVIGFILGLFTLTQEASGFNRYISTDIQNKNGAYYDIDIIDTAKIQNLTVNEIYNYVLSIENGGDPFAISWSYVASFIVILITVKMIINMFTSAYFGYISEKFSPYRKELNIRITFLIEIFMVGILNIIAPITAPFIREGTLSPIKILIAIAILTAATSLHIMFQYNGFLEHNDNKDSSCNNNYNIDDEIVSINQNNSDNTSNIPNKKNGYGSAISNKNDSLLYSDDLDEKLIKT